uniref:Nucleoporin NUP35 n=1 Tax=Panagrolaimus sp. PS1159 TaxID=55785 RepID=A0AC35F883_9BILA
MFFKSVKNASSSTISSSLDESNNSSAVFSSPTTTTASPPTRKPPKFTGCNPPPLNSINDEIIGFRRTAEQKSPKNFFQTFSPTEKEEEKEFWVTVFAFDQRKGIQPIIELFGKYGKILKTARPPVGKNGNWIHLRFATKSQAQHALQQKIHFIDNFIIGVIQDPSVEYGSTNPNEFLCEDFSILFDETLPD